MQRNLDMVLMMMTMVFFNETSDIVNASSTQTQVSAYLTDADRSLSMLDKYPVVKSTFIYYNTTIPSSAPVERLFSLGGR